MRIVLAMLFSVLIFSCVTSSRKEKNSNLKRISTCKILGEKEQCPTDNQLKELSKEDRMKFTPQKKDTEFYVTAEFDQAYSENTFHFALKDLKKNELGTSPSGPVEPLLTRKMSVPAGLIPGSYLIEVVSEGKSKIYGIVNGFLEVLPEARVSKGNLKFCLKTDEQSHQCETSLESLPEGTQEFYVTVIYDKLVPNESVSIQLHSEWTYLATDNTLLFKSDFVPVDRLSITEKMKLPEPTSKENVYVELHYQEKGLFEDLTAGMKLIYGKPRVEF